MVACENPAFPRKKQIHNLNTTLNIQVNLMAHEKTVLSLNSDGRSLLRQEVALKKGGFTVISVSSAIQARFEIEMGRCGIFLSSYITPPPIYSDLASLFRRSCPDGLIVFIAENDGGDLPAADILLFDQEEPEMVLQRIHSEREPKAS
jgi:hypothetical protein